MKKPANPSKYPTYHSARQTFELRPDKRFPGHVAIYLKEDRDAPFKWFDKARIYTEAEAIADIVYMGGKLIS